MAAAAAAGTAGAAAAAAVVAPPPIDANRALCHASVRLLLEAGERLRLPQVRCVVCDRSIPNNWPNKTAQPSLPTAQTNRSIPTPPTPPPFRKQPPRPSWCSTASSPSAPCSSTRRAGGCKSSSPPASSWRPRSVPPLSRIDAFCFWAWESSTRSVCMPLNRVWCGDPRDTPLHFPTCCHTPRTQTQRTRWKSTPGGCGTRSTSCTWCGRWGERPTPSAWTARRGRPRLFWRSIGCVRAYAGVYACACASLYAAHPPKPPKRLRQRS
jgi:hypothetical protein